ncbi:18.8 kDa class V heat shock protein [Oryza brachyantha]|uniref:18.8 kDa class V heat shock protein n=1 Tax=Oryza brachyantha TaxID=4533 RepID=UPI001ADCB434|nr:18.8 kDa class V heat shock protein [Oryza brachyantha]
MQPESDRSDRTGVAAESAMDYYYPMEEEEVVVHEHPRFRRPAHHPWQRQWQWQLLALLSSSSSSPAAAAAAAQRSNHVSWEETAAAHLYSVNLPGVRKEEIRVEVEDARYLAIRTELDGGGDRRSFARKFRLPAMVDADGISAEYTHGVLRVTVPRLHTRARPVVNLAAGAGPACDPVARAA